MDGLFFAGVLPMPPSINDYYANGEGQSKFVKPKGVAYRDAVYYLSRLQCPNHQVPNFTGRIRADIVFHFDNEKAVNDIDNRLKCFFDSLTYASVWADDRQVDKCVVERGKSVSGGMVVVRLYQHNEPLADPIPHNVPLPTPIDKKRLKQADNQSKKPPKPKYRFSTRRK